MTDEPRSTGAGDTGSGDNGLWTATPPYKWLPAPAGERQETRNALQTLAELMIKEHADYWLADVLRQAARAGSENCAQPSTVR